MSGPANAGVRKNALEGGKTFTLKGTNSDITITDFISAGASGMVYKGRRNGGGSKWTIVKEYYPAGSERFYEREDDGRLKFRDDTSDDIRNILKAGCEAGFEREEAMIRSLSEDREKQNNLPYIYSVTETIKMGDTSYLVMDTAEGCTLRSRMNEIGDAHRNNDGISGYIEDFENVFMAVKDVILERNDEREVCHEDLKPENIYMEGKLRTPMILDMGSAFSFDDFKLDADDDAAVLENADKIAEIEGIGCGTEEYASSALLKLCSAKETYLAQRNIDYARNLIDAVKQMRYSDLHSLKCIFLEIMTGFNRDRKRKIRKTGYTEDVKKALKEMDDKEYKGADDLAEDVTFIKGLVQGKPCTEVLIRRLKEEYSLSKYDIDISEEIFANM